MDDLCGLADDVAVWEAVYRKKEGRGQFFDAQLIAQLDSELASVCVLVAVVGSIANALELGLPVALSGADLLAFTPAHSAHFMSSVERFIANGNEIALGYELQTYATRLDVARKLTQCFHSRISPDFKDGGAYLEILSDAWRRVAGAAVDLGASFGRVLDRDAMRSVSVKQARTTEILKAVSVGEAPCVDTEGYVSIPGWAERRRSKRARLRQSATAIVAGRAQEVVVTDVSELGIGLLGSAGVDEAVRLTLDDGRDVTGTVKWSKDGRFGVMLDSG